MSAEGSGRGRRLAIGVLALAVVGALAVAGFYLSRLELARRAAVAWVRGQGVPADVQVQALTPTGLVASVRIGPADHPDLTINQAEVSYSLRSLLAGKGPQISRVRLQRPVLVGTWRQGRLQLGAVDRLLAGIKPPPKGAPAPPPPRIEIRSAVARLTTDYGLVQAGGDVDLDQGRLERAQLSLSPARLRAGEAAADLQATSLSARRTGDRLQLALQAPASRISWAQDTANGVVANLQADLSYAALEQGRIEGRVSADAAAASAGAGGIAARRLQLAIQSPDLALDLKANTGAGGFHLRLGAGDLQQQALRLRGLSADGAGRVQLDRTGMTARWAGGVSGAGQWPALGAAARDDAPVMAALKRGLRGFRFAVGKGRLAIDHGRFTAQLLSPAEVRTTSGGRLDLTPVGRGYRFQMAGGGLPEARADIRRVDIEGQTVAAQARVSAAFSLGLLDHAQVAADGRLTVRDGAAAFAPAGCADVAVKRLDFGDNSAEGFAAKLCPERGPMLTLSPGRWSIAGQAREASARVPMFEVALSKGSGAMRLHGEGQAVGAELTVDRVEVLDRARPLRFHPVTASGRAVLANDLFSGGADVRAPKGQTIAHADFRQEVQAMKGGMTVSMPDLTFVPGVLQPTDLSPLTSALGEPATGQVSFKGRFDWVRDKVTSSGTLTAKGLNFKSPAGPVTGASGEMAFTSLTPVLVGASVGPIRAARVAGVVPLTDISALAKVADNLATVTDGQGSVGGGHVRLNASASLDADATVKGEVVMDKVQMHDLVASSPFSDRVSLTAQLSGRLPFQMVGGKLRIAKGAANADAPGRLSIARSAFNPGGAASGPATQDNLSTFGYQAMEDLAFQVMDASIDSQADGRLRMVFHIKGRHDPPAKKELRLTWRDFFDRKILSKSMPLPSNTEVNLTLDTTLNLDNLIQSQGAVERQLGSASVQPANATLGVKTSEGRK